MCWNDCLKCDTPNVCEAFVALKQVARSDEKKCASAQLSSAGGMAPLLSAGILAVLAAALV